MRKLVLLFVSALLALGLATGCAGTPEPPADPVQVVKETPVNLEQDNPVPMVLHWVEGDRALYYFNWGIKSTGGYYLEYAGLDGDRIRVKAVEPAPGSMVNQVITYPSLVLSLPKGDYTYVVTDEQGAEIEFPGSRSEPLTFKVLVPRDEGNIERTVCRDPYQGNEGKTTGRIWLEALFEQPEFAQRNYNTSVRNVGFDADNWVVLVSEGYGELPADKKAELEHLIKETLLANPVQNLTGVKITTNPDDLPPPVN